jgi:hypothetical protein
MEKRPTDKKQKAKGKEKTANKTKSPLQFSFFLFLFAFHQLVVSRSVGNMFFSAKNFFVKN